MTDIDLSTINPHQDQDYPTTFALTELYDRRRKELQARPGYLAAARAVTLDWAHAILSLPPNSYESPRRRKQFDYAFAQIEDKMAELSEDLAS